MLAGTDVAKDASDMIMLDKDLEKIAEGVAIGRITYGGISAWLVVRKLVQDSNIATFKIQLSCCFTMPEFAQNLRLYISAAGNTVKYIKFAASSSFGNTFSILAGAAWLPFNPLAPIQVLALNLLYNISQMAIPVGLLPWFCLNLGTMT